MKEFIKDVLIALVIVVVITLIIKPTIVKESSMESTLYENNYLFVNKLAYLTADHPDYGDIIVFKSHIQRDDGKGDKLLIKRVIGVENDVIDIHDGVVYRNGTALDEPYTKEGYTEGDISDLYEAGCKFPGYRTPGMCFCHGRQPPGKSGQSFGGSWHGQ